MRCFEKPLISQKWKLCVRELRRALLEMVAHLKIAFQDSKSVGQMSLSPSLFCYNTDQQFRWNNFAFLYFLQQFCFPLLFVTISRFSFCYCFVFFCELDFYTFIVYLILYLTLFLRQGLRGDHWVLYNYIKAKKQFQVISTLIFVHVSIYESSIY